MKKKKINFLINNKEVEVEIAPNSLLVDILREKLDFTSVKKGCEEGECGACTVLIDGENFASCIYPAMKVEGKNITTVEGIPEDEFKLFEEEFLKVGAVQCGYCTPGILLSTKALLDKNPTPSRKEIREGVSGNLCRCTGYQKIVDAVESIAARKRKEVR